MPGNALLIGAELDGLIGVGNDLDMMATALASRGLAVSRCAGKDATRAGILAAYERLIDITEAGDVAVVYYSGHGGSVRPPGVASRDLLDMRFIAPIDYYDSRPDDFRGIAAVELSVLLARLTTKTNNVVVLLDCCHAAHMSRDHELRVRALSRLVHYEQLRDHIDRLLQAGQLRTELLAPTGNPHAVRIVACAPEQSAFEYRNRDDQPIGILTESLTMALAEAGDEHVTWATLMERVRRRVVTLAPAQRPEVEGPARRLLFDTVEEDPLTTLRAAAIPDGRVRLECAPLLGVRHGDTFSIMPPGHAVVVAAEKVGDLVVDRVEPLAAEGSVTFNNGWTNVPLGARAHRATAVAPGIPVLLPDHDPRAADLVRAVATAPMLRFAGPDEPWSAAVRVRDSGELSVSDRIGPVTPPRPADAIGIATVVRDLTALARASALRDLVGDVTWALDAPITVEWGLALDGRGSPLANAGALVPAGAEIYVCVRNHGADPIYVSLVDIGVSGRITVLTRSSPSGVKLTSGAAHVYGYDEVNRVLTGMPLTWPEGLDATFARQETVLLLVTSAPQDVGVLEQDGAHRSSTAAMSPLQRMLDQIASGRVRDLSGRFDPIVRYDVHAIDFELDPLGARGPSIHG